MFQFVQTAKNKTWQSFTEVLHSTEWSRV